VSFQVHWQLKTQLFLHKSADEVYKSIRLEENLKAESITLTQDDLCQIESAFSAIKLQGARFPAALQN